MAEKTYTKENLMPLLKKWHAKTGLFPTRKNIDEDKTIPTHSTFIRYFGSLSEAIKAAGIKKPPFDYVKSFNKKIEKGDNCWLWNAAIGSAGYGKFNFHGKAIDAHRVAYMIFKGEIPKGLLVCHTCDVKKCVNPNHLFIGTDKDNMDDKIKKGRARGGSLPGMSSPSAKLTNKQVKDIRKKYANKTHSVKQLCIKYNLIESHVRKIIRREIWKHI